MKPPLSPVSFVDRSGSEEVGRGGEVVGGGGGGGRGEGAGGRERRTGVERRGGRGEQ